MSTNDMVTIFSTGQIKHPKINNVNDEKLRNFDKSFVKFAKRIVLDGEGATKFITVNVKNCKTENDAKIASSIANSSW